MLYLICMLPFCNVKVMPHLLYCHSPIYFIQLRSSWVCINDEYFIENRKKKDWKISASIRSEMGMKTIQGWSWFQLTIKNWPGFPLNSVWSRCSCFNWCHRWLFLIDDACHDNKKYEKRTNACISQQHNKPINHDRWELTNDTFITIAMNRHFHWSSGSLLHSLYLGHRVHAESCLHVPCGQPTNTIPHQQWRTVLQGNRKYLPVLSITGTQIPEISSKRCRLTQTPLIQSQFPRSAICTGSLYTKSFQEQQMTIPRKHW